MRNKILISIAILTGCTSVAVWMSAQQITPETVPSRPPTMLIDVMQVQKTTEAITVTVHGSVTPRTQTILVSEVSGLITEVSDAFVAGGFFSKGDVLIRIDDRNYRAEVKRAEASVAAAQTNVTREVGLADYAEADWKRAKSLLSSSKAASDLALRKPQLAEAMAQLAYSEADLAKRLGDLDRTVIRAPYDGLVREKKADLGQFVAAGTPLAETFAIDVAEIRLPLPDRELPYLNLPEANSEPGSGPEVLLQAEIGGIVHQWQGRIVRTEGVFDERSRVLYVVAQIHDPYNRFTQRWDTPLRMGTFVQADISGKKAENVFKLPRRVLYRNNQIWTVDSNDQLVKNTITLFRADDKSIFVSDGLNANDLVCLTALDNPLPGTPVRYETASRSE